MTELLLLTEGLLGRVVDQRMCVKMARLYEDVNGGGGNVRNERCEVLDAERHGWELCCHS